MPDEKVGSTPPAVAVDAVRHSHSAFSLPSPNPPRKRRGLLQSLAASCSILRHLPGQDSRRSKHYFFRPYQGKITIIDWTSN